MHNCKPDKLLGNRKTKDLYKNLPKYSYICINLTDLWNQLVIHKLQNDNCQQKLVKTIKIELILPPISQPFYSSIFTRQENRQ